MSSWNALVLSSTQHLVTSLTTHEYVTPTFFKYATSFLTVHDMGKLGFSRNMSGMCGNPMCPELANSTTTTMHTSSAVTPNTDTSHSDTSHSGNTSSTKKNQKLSISKNRIRFCCQSCADLFENRKSEIEKMDPVSFRDGILQLIQRSNPKLPIRRLMTMKERATGMRRNANVMKSQIVEKDSLNSDQQRSKTLPYVEDEKSQKNPRKVSSEQSESNTQKVKPTKDQSVPSQVTSSVEVAPTSILKQSNSQNITSINSQSKKQVKFEDINNIETLALDRSTSIMTEVKEKSDAKPSREILDSIKNGSEITLEGYVIPNAFSNIEAEEREAKNPSIDSEENSLYSEDEFDDEIPLTVSLNDNLKAREIFFGDLDSDEDLEEGSIDIKQYLNSGPSNFSIYQRLFLTISRWMTPEASNYIHRLNARYKPWKPPQNVFEDEEMRLMRKAFESMGIDPDAPRSRDIPTSDQLKKPTRKRKAPTKVIQATEPNTSISPTLLKASVPEENNPAEIGIENSDQLREDRYMGSHIALNDPAYKRYEASIANIQRVLPKISSIMNLKDGSIRKLMNQLNTLISTMSHIDAPECINDKDWEVLCIILLQALQKSGSLVLEERNLDSVDEFVLMNYVMEKGLTQDNYNALIDTVIDGF